MLNVTAITKNKKSYVTFVACCIALLVFASVVMSVLASFLQVDDQKVQGEVRSFTVDLREQVSLPSNLNESRQRKNLQLYTPVQHPEVDNLGKRNPFLPTISQSQNQSSSTEDGSGDDTSDTPQPVNTNNPLREIVISLPDNEQVAVPDTSVQDTSDQGDTTQQQSAT